MKIKQPKTKMNVLLLRRIERQIMAEPKQFNMGAWFSTNESIPNCGTAACIAGWAAALSWKVKPSVAQKRKNNGITPAFFQTVSKMLGITGWQAMRLFYVQEWPPEFQKLSHNNPKQAVRRIEHFIKTGGKE